MKIKVSTKAPAKKPVKVKRIKIEGRWAHVAQFDDDGTIKILFDDGEVRFATPS